MAILDTEDPKFVSWRFIVALVAALLVVVTTTFSGITGWLVSQGIDSLQKNNSKMQTQMDSICSEFRKSGEATQDRESRLERRLDRMEILITMPFDKRLEVLRNLMGVEHNGGGK